MHDATALELPIRRAATLRPYNGRVYARDAKLRLVSSVQIAGITDRGQTRIDNEDSIAVRPDLGLAVLADGMGGHQAGEVASRIAVDVIARHFEAVDVWVADDVVMAAPDEASMLLDSIHLANDAIYSTAHAQAECRGMGSTVVVAMFQGHRLYAGHVGDSRLYRWRAGNIERLTRDHSVVQELVNRGLCTEQEARLSVGKNLVTRALGVDTSVTPDVTEQECESGDIYLLCSDGLNDVVPDDEIAAAISQNIADIEITARCLVDMANERGAPDNVSVILARCSD